jgi:hypothetical protein
LPNSAFGESVGASSVSNMSRLPSYRVGHLSMVAWTTDTRQRAAPTYAESSHFRHLPCAWHNRVERGSNTPTTSSPWRPSRAPAHTHLKSGRACRSISSKFQRPRNSSLLYKSRPAYSFAASPTRCRLWVDAVEKLFKRGRVSYIWHFSETRGHPLVLRWRFPGADRAFSTASVKMRRTAVFAPCPLGR